MNWCWKIGTFRGITLRLHATFLLVLVWVLLTPLLMGHGWVSALTEAVFVALLFGCIVLHELGHALMALRYGIRTHDITLYPIGGVARLARMPREPGQELRIALAGPAVNLGVGLLLLAGVAAIQVWVGGPANGVAGGSLAYRLLWTNLGLAGFNLLPAFPMDGGRILRAYLAGKMDYGRATRYAAETGRAMAYFFALCGLLLFPSLLFIAFFVYLGATEEQAAVETELGFRGVPAFRGMMTQFTTLSPADPLSLAVEQLLAGAQDDFPVVDQGILVGMLPRAALVAALREHGEDVPLAQVMGPAPAVISPDENLENVYQRFQEQELRALPVAEHGRLIGLITLENLGELLLVRQALDQHACAVHRPANLSAGANP